MAGFGRDGLLIGAALGTFHAAALTLALVLPLFLAGDLGELLSGLDTLLGLAVYGLLWLVTCFCTYRGLEEAHAASGDALRLGPILRHAFSWGAYNGVIFFNCLLAAVVVVALASAILDDDSNNAAGIVVFGATAFGVGTVAASIVGGVLGLLIGAVDALLLRVARALTA